jgi:iron complex outermembrane recepter protein
MSGRSALWLAISLGTAALIPTHDPRAQDAGPAADSEPLQEVMVTGSLIPRTAEQSPGPIRVISAIDLQQSGYTDVSDVLRNLPSNGASTLTQNNPSAYAGGASGISLRGLTVGETLTLIDGHRMVPYPLSDDNQRTFVDLSSIPDVAIDRIEVLEDGASSEYGSDAIAGVVNVLLKKTYQGVQLNAEAGTSQRDDGTLEHITGIVGLGDLGSQGFNFYTAIELRHQDAILVTGRQGLFTNRNWAPYGGVDIVHGSAGNAFEPYPPTVTGSLFNPNDPNAAPAYLPGCSAAAQAADHCQYVDPGPQLQTPTRNLNVISRLTLRLSDGWQLSTTASFFESRAEQSFSYAEAIYPNPEFAVGLEPGGAPTINGPYFLSVPANYPGNPFGVPAAIDYTFHELGDGHVTFCTDTYRLALELAGVISGWDVTANANVQYANTLQTENSAIDLSALQNALNNGYRIGLNASPNGAALFAPPTVTTATSTMNVLSAYARRSVLALPGGPLTTAFGTEVDEFVADARAAPTVADGEQNGNNAYVIGSQTDTALFAEAHAPLLKILSVDAAGRYDHYNTYGGSLTPKFGLRLAPLAPLSLFATWGKGFRAPSPAESQKAAYGFSLGAIPDPILCPNPSNPSAPGNYPSQCDVSLLGLQVTNPKLRPETSTDLTLGATLHPDGDWTLSADFYRIKVDDAIIPVYEAGGYTNSSAEDPPLVRSAPLTLPYVIANGTLVNQLTPVGAILYQPFPYVNATSTETQGLDVDLIGKRSLGAAGELNIEFNYTRVLLYDLDAYGLTYELAGTHGPSQISGDTGTPRDRARMSLSWARGPVSLTTTVNYVGAFSVTDTSVGQDTCDEAVYAGAPADFLYGTPIPRLFCTVKSFTDVDLYGQYRLNGHVTLHASILNLFDTSPPVDIVTYGSSASYDPAFHQAGAVGRFFTAGVTATF